MPPDNPQSDHVTIPVISPYGQVKAYFAISPIDANWVKKLHWEITQRRIRTRSLSDAHICYATKLIALAIQGYDLLELSPPEIIKLYGSQSPVRQLNRDTLDLRRENLKFNVLSFLPDRPADGPAIDQSATDPSAIDPSVIDLSDEDWPALDKPIETDTNDLLARLSALDRGPRPEQNPNKK